MCEHGLLGMPSQKPPDFVGGSVNSYIALVHDDVKQPCRETVAGQPTSTAVARIDVSAAAHSDTRPTPSPKPSQSPDLLVIYGQCSV